MPGLDFPVPFNTDGTVAWPEADPTSPFYVHGPALISFSGGRTSAFMLFQILWAHGGKLPDDVHVCFANTGLEDEKTLRFVHECSVRWRVNIVWLEYVDRPMGLEGRRTPHGERFQIVGFNSAARNGEPFRALVERKKFLPNAVTRFCTSHLKVETMKAYMRSLGYERWANIIGLRRDEMHRVFKQVERNDKGIERFTTIMPMSTKAGGVGQRDIFKFWHGDAPMANVIQACNDNDRSVLEALPMRFDLGLWPWGGNCKTCMLKGFETLVHIERTSPGSCDVMIGMEDRASELADKPSGARFVTEYSYREIKAAASQPLLIPLNPEEVEFDAECGLWCAGEAA